jgi:uncharacterized protein YutE (UPF0331/DUF86 family)
LPSSPILKNAVESLEHAIDHWSSGSAKDRKFAILHLDQAVELILKERILSLGASIYKRDKKTTVSAGEALEMLREMGHSVPEAPQLELLHDERNQIQHRSSSPDQETTTFYMEAGLHFVIRFLQDELRADPGALFSQDVMEVFEDRDPRTKLASMIESARGSVESDPRESILSSAIAAELLLQTKFANEASEIESAPLDAFARTLEGKGLITQQQIQSIHELANLRNTFSHGEAEPRPDEARRALHLIDGLRTELLGRR